MRLFVDPTLPPEAPPQLYLGEVTAVRTGVEGHGTVWHAVYEDGDEEDLILEVLVAALMDPVYPKEDGALEVKRVKREA